MVISERYDGKEWSLSWRYYLLSGTPGVETFAQAVREHWEIENGLHWTFDVAFREDDSRLSEVNAAQNFALIKRMAVSLLKQDTSTKAGIKTRRMKAALNEEYLLGVLLGTTNEQQK